MSNAPTNVGDLLKALEGVHPETPLFVSWGPGSEHYSVASEMNVNTYDITRDELYVAGDGEPVPPPESKTVEIFVIGPGYGPPSSYKEWFNRKK